MSERGAQVLTPDQRLRVFISSTLLELAPERVAARRAIEELRLTPVFFEHGARPHPPEALYRAYLEQSQIFVGIYWQSYGWVAPGADLSGLEDEFRRSTGMPRLLYLKGPAPEREERLAALVTSLADDPSCTYTHFRTAEELERLLATDLALLLSERSRADSAPAGTASTIPAPPTSFVGRDAELERIEQLVLREGARLVTLSGPGGIGKTRTAIEAARRLADHFGERVAFVPLDGIDDPGRVLPTIAAELGVRETASDILEALAHHLRGRALLLVLDNFEHVIAASPALGVLIERAPELTVLVTSRELLKLRGEHEVALPPLAPEEEAVALFRQRAGSVGHGALERDALPVVAEICRRLDGVPLAIELAAPMLRLLTPEQLLARLSERLDLVGARDAPVRQQTLAAAIGWSYELLDDDERRLFDQLGVFRGSFTLEEVEGVCRVPEGSDMLELLASLLDKSMVYRAPVEGARFAMLVMIRDFAHDRMQSGGGLDETFARYADFYVRLAPEAERGLRSVEQRRWKHLLDLEADNLRAVLTGLGERRRGPDLARLLRGLWVWFWLRGQLAELRERLQVALDDPEVPAADRGWLLGIDAWFALLLSNYDVAYERLAEARALLADAGDEHGLAMVQIGGAFVLATFEGEEAAQRQTAANLATFERLADAWGAAMSLNVMAHLRAIFARYDGAGDLFVNAVEASERVGDEMLMAMSLSNLAESRLAAGDVVGARRSAARGLGLLHASSSSFVVPELLETLAACSATQGAHEEAAELAGAAAGLRERMLVPVLGPARERNELLLQSLRDALGDERYAAAQERGRARPVDALIPTGLEPAVAPR